MKETLTQEEYDVVDILTVGTSYELETLPDGTQIINDRFDDKTYGLYEGIKKMDAEISDISFLTDEEKYNYITVLFKVEMKLGLTSERLREVLCQTIELAESILSCNLLEDGLAQEIGITEKEYNEIMKGRIKDEPTR